MIFLRNGLILLLATMVVTAVPAQQPPVFEPPANPSRYWIIVEKTRAARPFERAIRQTLFDLVYKGAGGEMVDGSVFELWIFGEKTDIRGFVPEMLMPGNHLEVAQKATRHLQNHPVSGPGNMEEFVEHVRNMASVVFETTVFFISAPTTRLSGTTVDDEVNAIYEVHGPRLVAEGKPFITTFRVQDGKLAAYAVSESALALALPPMPASSVTDEERARMIAEARAEIDARETARLQAIAEAEKARIEAEEAARRQEAMERQKPDEEREGAIILRGSPKKENQTRTEPVAATTDDVAEDASSNPVPTGSAPPVQPVETATKVAVPDPVDSAAPPRSEETGQAVAQLEEETPPTVGTEDSVNDEPRAKEDSAPAASTEEVSEESQDDEIVPSDDSAADDGSVDPKMNPKEFAVQPQTWFTAGGLFAAGVLFFIVAGLLVWIAIKRTRTASGPSYITRSMQNNRRIDRS